MASGIIRVTGKILIISEIHNDVTAPVREIPCGGKKGLNRVQCDKNQPQMEGWMVIITKVK